MAASTTYLLIFAGAFQRAKGTDSITEKRIFDGVNIYREVSGTLTVCGNQAVVDFFQDKIDNDICTPEDFVVFKSCDGVVDITPLFEGSIDPCLVVIDNCACEVELPIQTNTCVPSDISESETLKLGQAAVNQVDFFQFESGGYYADEEVDTHNLFDAIEEILDLYCPGYTLTPNLIYEFNQDMIENVWTLGNTGAVVGDIVRVEIDSMFQDSGPLHVGSYRVQTGDTATLINEGIRNTLLFLSAGVSNVGLNDEIVPYLLQSVVASPAGVVITSDWQITAIRVFVNGVLQPAIPAETTPWQWGLANFAFSNPGMNGRTQINWQAIKCLFKAMGFIFDWTDQNGLRILTYQEAFGTGGTASITLSGDKIRTSVDQEYKFSKVDINREFSYSSIASTQENWLPSGGVFEDAGNPALLYALLNAGNGRFGNTLGIINGTGALQTFNVEIRLNGGIVAVQTVNNLPNGSTVVLDVNGMFSGAPANEFCVAIGDTIEAQIVPAVGGLNFTGPPDTVFGMTTSSICFNNPQAIPDEQQSQFEITKFADCKGLKDLKCDPNFNVDLGYGASQQIEGFEDYSDTIFGTFIDPVTPTLARRFQRLVYHDNDPDLTCTCLQNSIGSYFYYNIPLSLPFMLYYLNKRIPGGISRTEFTFTRSFDVDAAGAYFINIDRQADQPATEEHCDIKAYNHEVCLSIDDYRQINTDGRVFINDCGTIIEVIPSTMQINIGEGTSSFSGLGG